MICCVSHKHSISKQQGKQFYIKHEIYQMIKVFTFILFSLRVMLIIQRTLILKVQPSGMNSEVLPFKMISE